MNDKSTVSKAAAVCFIIAVNGPALQRCHGEGLMTVPSEQMEVKELFGTSEGGAILAIGGRGSCCLSASFGASAAIEGAPLLVSVIFQEMVTFTERCRMGFFRFGWSTKTVELRGFADQRALCSVKKLLKLEVPVMSSHS